MLDLTQQKLFFISNDVQTINFNEMESLATSLRVEINWK